MALEERHLRLTSNLHIHAHTCTCAHTNMQKHLHIETQIERGKRFLASLGLNVLDHDMRQMAN